MKHRRKDQRMNCGGGVFHPVEQGIHLSGDKIRRRSHEDAAIPAEYTFVSAAKYAGFLYSQISHDAMKLLQISDGKWIKTADHIVRLIGIFNFLNFFLRTKYSSAGNNPLDLVQRKRVCFDSE